MIKSVEINNFKGLSNFHLNNLSHINLFGGKNNVGKTTFLEALFMFYDRLNPNMILRQFNWRGVNEVSLTPEALFAPIFKDFDLSNRIDIRIINRNGSTESLIINFDKNENRVVKMESIDGQIRTDDNPIVALASLVIKYRKNEGKEQISHLIIEQKGLGMELKNVSNPDKNAAFLASKSHVHPNENAIRFGELDMKGQSQPIVEYLKVIEPDLKGISSIALPNGTAMLYGDIGIGPKIPITYMGDGISRLLTILLAIVTHKNGLVFIDEIENGLHYSVQDKIWEIIGKAAKEFNCQIFATTHSYECLNAAVKGLPLEIRNDFKYFRFEKNKESRRVIPKEFDYEVLQAAVERGWEVR
ncbi:AAA family ATPase [Geobacillus stearothermophilus]|nr:AAA family ATPase [Geobacillus stearothermophilus]